MKSLVVLRALSLLTCAVAAPSSLHAVSFGAGLVFSSGADSGERLNVDETFSQTLAPGTYSVSDFSYFSTADVGSSVPFLATLNGADTYDLLWIGTGLNGVLNASVSTDPAGYFTLASTTTVFGGFYNAAGGRIAFGTVGGQTTDHDGAFAVPRGGVTTTDFSNPNLGRTYAFGISAVPTPMLVGGPGMLANGGVDGGNRLNIDRAHAFALGAGTYNVDDFAFNGTAAVGTVTPFLVRDLGGNSFETVWVGGGLAGAIGGVSADPGGSFTLASGESLYAGFFTADGATVAFTEGVARPPGFGITAHDDSFTGPTGAGQSITGFAFPTLERQYSFNIALTSVPEPASTALLFVGSVAVLGLRKRRSCG